MRELFITIWKYLRPYKKMVYFLMFLALLAAAISSVIPMIYGWLVDQALSQGHINLIGVGLLFWFVLSLMSSWFNRIISRYSDLLSARVESGVIIDFANHFLHLPVAYLKDQKVGQMINKSDRAAMNMENIVQRIMFYFLPDLITIFFILILIIKISWILSSILLFILLAYVLVTFWKSKKIIISNKKINKAYNRAYGDHYEYLAGYGTVKASSAEDSMIKTIGRKFKSIIDVRWKSEMVWNNLSIWQETIFSLGFVGLFGMGILMLKSGNVTAGNLVTFVGYISFIFGVLSRLGMHYNAINRAIAEVSGLNKILKVKTETDVRYGVLKKLGPIAGEVVFDKVKFKYKNKDQTWVLDNMSFRVNPGEVIALVGESGAGKTTLVDLIFGDYVPNKGNVLIDGYNTKKINPKDLRRHLAIVPQEVVLFHESISFNINYGNRGASQEKIEAIAKEANAHEFIMKFQKGYSSKVGERGVKLSVGQKQRIAIARALLSDPDILILDEATSALDSITEKAVQDALERLIRGRTTFVIAHRLSTIIHADRIFVLDGGRIVETGTHQDLLERGGVYKKLYDVQKL